MKRGRELRGKDIGHNNRFLLLDSTERIFLLVLPRVQAIIPQLWKTAETEEGPQSFHRCMSNMSLACSNAGSLSIISVLLNIQT